MDWCISIFVYPVTAFLHDFMPTTYNKLHAVKHGLHGECLTLFLS